jgi:hypothetical protein
MPAEGPDQDTAAARGVAANQRGVARGAAIGGGVGATLPRGTPAAAVPTAPPSVPLNTFSTKRLRPLNELPDAAFQRVVAENVSPQTPFVVTVPATPPAKGTKDFLARLRSGESQSGGSYLVWGEKGQIRGWVPISEVPKGPSRSDDGRWWIWSDDRQLQVAERYTQDPAEVAAGLAKPTPWERQVGVQRKADPQDVRRRVDAGAELNRDIEKYLVGGSFDPVSKKSLPPMALDQARAKTLRAHQDVLEVMVVGTALIFSSPMEPFTPTQRGVPFGATRTRLAGSKVGHATTQLAENGLHEKPVVREAPPARRASAPAPAEQSFSEVEVPKDFDPNKAGGAAADFRPPSRMPPGSQSSVPFVESRGASAGKGPVYQSASARTPKSLLTSIRPDVAESQAYMAALKKGEIGLQRPLGANIGGTDMITAVRRADGTLRVVVTDVASTTTGRVGKGPPVLKAKWLAEVREAVSPSRLDLGNPALEAEIQAAVGRGDVDVRIVSVDYSKAGTISGL